MRVYIKSRFLDEPADLAFKHYQNGRIAILAYSPFGEPLAHCTVNLPEHHLSPNEVIIKGWSENEGIPEALEAAGVIGPALRAVPTGHVQATVHILSPAALVEYRQATSHPTAKE